MSDFQIVGILLIIFTIGFFVAFFYGVEKGRTQKEENENDDLKIAIFENIIEKK